MTLDLLSSVRLLLTRQSISLGSNKCCVKKNVSCRARKIYTIRHRAEDLHQEIIRTEDYPFNGFLLTDTQFKTCLKPININGTLKMKGKKKTNRRILATKALELSISRKQISIDISQTSIRLHKYENSMRKGKVKLSCVTYVKMQFQCLF